MGLAHDHEVGGDGHTGAELAQDLVLGAQVVTQGVGGEAAEVKQLAGVVLAGGQARREDLVPVGVSLRPEGRAPGLVEGGEVPVTLGEPDAEGSGGVVGVVVGVVAAQLVVHVPGHEGGVVVVAAGEPPCHLQGVAAEHRGRGAPLLASAGPQGVPLEGDGQDLGVGGSEPRRRRGGGRGHVHVDAGAGQEVHDAVEPVQVPGVLVGLDPGPGEDGEGHHGDAGFLHEAHVLRPDLLRPLVGVVVGAVVDGGTPPGGAARKDHGGCSVEVARWVVVEAVGSRMWRSRMTAVSGEGGVAGRGVRRRPLPVRPALAAPGPDREGEGRRRQETVKPCWLP